MGHTRGRASIDSSTISHILELLDDGSIDAGLLVTSDLLHVHHVGGVVATERDEGPLALVVGDEQMGSVDGHLRIWPREVAFLLVVLVLHFEGWKLGLLPFLR